MERTRSLVKKIMLEIGVIEEMSTTGGNKEVPQTLPFICENRFSPFHSVLLKPAFQNFVTLEKDDFAKFLAK